MSPAIPAGVMLLEAACGFARALRIDAGGSEMTYAFCLLVALLPAAYWITERLVFAWDASHSAN